MEDTTLIRRAGEVLIETVVNLAVFYFIFIKPVFVGFMRLITFNYKLFHKPTELGWQR